ncbi:DUF1887 family CARF protein [Alloalcanivorax xenomutans]|uniref:Card1-like endonuclease domain-containing protein n=1 Tax=Alloalcanivorax xenomutans TaxID=1094342 RepID=UPI003A800F55
MKQFKTHFCLVSQQAAPNLLPLLDHEAKPEKVVLLVTPQMTQQADYLEQVIKPRGIKVIRHALHVADNFEAMEASLIDLLENEPADEIALNVTGGTKWMAIAAQEVFRMNGSAVFYVDAADDRMLFLDSQSGSHHLSQHIDLNTYIQSYGYAFREKGTIAGLPQNLRDLCQQLVLKVNEWQGAIGQLNLLASEAERTNTLAVSMNSTIKHPDPQLAVLLNECTAAGLLSSKVTDTVHFTDETARSWANGGWLEYYVNSKLNELKGEGVIQDSPRLNLHIHRQGATSHNEVDVCFMARNRLHLIECKTKRMAGKGSADVTTDTVYKMDSIRDLGGLATQSMLISYRKLKAADQQRAKDLKINVLQGTQIQQLKSALRDWIER